MIKISDRAKKLQQSGIRASTERCNAIGGINLGQGVCDIPTPDMIKEKAYQVIADNKSVYSSCEGIIELRQAVSQKLSQFNHIKADPYNEVIITHGSTGAFVCAIMTLFNSGDEVILFEPFYGYHRNILEINNINVKTVPIDLNDFSIDINVLKNAIGKNTRGIVICTPCNPCGKVFTKSELLEIGKIAEQHDLCIITDEIYEYIVYPGYSHVSIASLQNFNQRTVTISGFSKTYNMTGWRLGYATGPAEVIGKMALVQDYIYVCPATPLQYATQAAFSLHENYYKDMANEYLHKRDTVVTAMRQVGFKMTPPQGAYYILLDFSDLGFKDDEAAATYLLNEAKVSTVPGSAFYLNPADGKNILRLCFALNENKVGQAMQQILSTMSK